MRGSRILAAAAVTVAAAITSASPALADNSGDNNGKSTGSSATSGAATGTVTGIETATGTHADVGTVPGGTTGTGTITGTNTGAVTPGTGTVAGVSDLNLLGVSAGVTADATGNAVITSAGDGGRVAFMPDSAGPGQPVTVNANMATCRAGDATATAVSLPEGLFAGALAVTTRTTTGLTGSYPVLPTVEPGTYTVVVTCTSPSLGSEADSNILRVTAGNAGDEEANSVGNDRDREEDRDGGRGEDHDGGGYGRGHGDSDAGDRCGSWWGDDDDRGRGAKNCRGGHGRGGGHGEDDGGDGRGGDGGYGGGNGSGPDTGFGGSFGMTIPETLLGAAFLVAGAGAGVHLLRRRRVNGDRA